MESISDQSGNGNPTKEASDVEPILEASAANGGNGDGDDGPPTDRASLTPRSRLAIRDDGAILVSLEDAGDRDLTGREVISFLILTAEEGAHARRNADDAFSGATANIIARLPKRAS